MKKYIKFIVFAIILMFICNFNIIAKEVVKTCYYNFSGISPNNDFKKDAYLELNIYDEGKPMGKGINDFEKFVGDDPVINWGKSENSFDARKYYMNSNKCPEYAIYYVKNMEITGPDEQLFLSDYEHFNTLSDWIEGWTWRRGNLNYFKLIEKEESSVETVCDYDLFTINYNSNKKVIKVDSNSKSDIKYFATTEMSQNTSSIDLCQQVYLCEVKRSVVASEGFFETANLRYIFYSDYSDWDVKNCKKYKPKSNESKNKVCQKYTLLLNGNDAKNIDGMDDYWSRYKSCKENNDAACIAEEISNYNSKKDTLKEWCNSVVSSRDYDDNCVEKCLELDKDLLTIEGKSDGDNDIPDCVFSDKLFAWILNIVKLIKYIIPAIVIILGILDFIKAIASDKDDEMKKAQGRFIKRLIAAALIFIIPFIIEFALDKMGFAEHIKDCGVTDLF